MQRYPQPGDVLLGKYRIDSLIGEGGMGAVLKAHHLELDEPVAIKVLLVEMMDRKDIVTRFLREAKASAKLKGDHVARVHDVGRLPNQQPFIVMEYLDGSDLGEIIKHYGKQDVTVSVDLLLQACEAMAEAHALGIIHRDIKASNFFVVQPEGQPACLKVLDFGIATAPEGTSDLTSTQSVIGTPAYMAPEQMRAAIQADARSDIWSMGVVLYELLEGARPFRSDVYSELVLKVGMDPPYPMENPSVPDALEDVIMTCLEKDMDRRFQNVAELAAALAPFASDRVAARAAVEQCKRYLRRSSRTMDVPDSGPVRRITPRSHAAVSAEKTPTSQSRPQLPPAAQVLGRPTPANPGPRTPTSQGSQGQVQPVPSITPTSHKVFLAFLVIVLVGVGGGAIYYTQFRDSAPATANQPAPPPPPPPEPQRELDYTPTRPDDVVDAGVVDAKPSERRAR